MTQQTIQPGKFVSLTYTIRDQNGEILEQNDIPVNYVHGGPQVLIGGMESAVANKSEGDIVELRVPPDKGFGDHDPNLTFIDDMDNVPLEFRHVGAEVQMQNEAGEIKTFRVSRIRNGKLTLDGNHPLAGKTLQVRVKIHEIRDATPLDYEQAGGSCTIN